MVDISLIKYPLFTEKSNKLLDFNKYVFLVDLKATKKDIKILFEELFNIHVLSVNSCILPLKKRRLGRFAGFKSSLKKVIVTLKSGEVIPFFPK